ncbi:MAG: hypothetical protein CVU69_13165 [Deltaproteobacteria bacterium HGW-Deltaproteobacteria-4]|nr:MAG: hypothetical protein CVU69_13165 [Deltaproteobacteria bacterium HGW-Deltaproteobacteria-4]
MVVIADERTALTLESIDEYYVFLLHVSDVIDSDLSKSIGLKKWLDEIISLLRKIKKSLYSGSLAGNWKYDDNEELEDLELLIDQDWVSTILNLKDFQKDKLEPIADLLVKLVEFWTEEIKSRGYLIHGLLDGSEDYDTVKSSLQNLKRINYPPI